MNDGQNLGLSIRPLTLMSPVVNLGGISAASILQKKSDWSQKLTSALTLSTALAVGFIEADISNTSWSTFPDKNEAAKPVIQLSWISKEVVGWLSKTHSNPSISVINDLRKLIVEIFGEVSISTEMYQDPDESWNKAVVKISSNLADDFDKQLALEERFFEAAFTNDPVKSLLQHMIITQV